MHQFPVDGFVGLQTLSKFQSIYHNIPNMQLITQLPTHLGALMRGKPFWL